MTEADDNVAAAAGRMSGAVAAIQRRIDLEFHMITCEDSACPTCRGERARQLERAFAKAGEDEYCPECWHYRPPYEITDDVEDIVL